MKCPSQSYFLDGVCIPCASLCLECNTECYVCVENAELDNNNTCLCNEGFNSSNNTCEKQLFNASIVVKSINLIEIKFSEPTKNELKVYEFELFVDNRTDFKSEYLKSISKTEYLFSLSFVNSVDEGTIIKVKINVTMLISTLGSQLNEYVLNGSLPSYTPIIISESIAAVLNSTTAMAQTVVSSSIGASLMSNPAAAWALLNSIQILIFLPINSNNMTQTIRTFLSGFSGYNILPNLVGSIFSSKASTEPYLEARRYGIASSVFLVNTGKILILFVVTCMLIPFIFALSKFSSGKIAAKAIKILGNYRYGFFLRFWTQSYLELMIYGLIQLRSVNYI